MNDKLKQLESKYKIIPKPVRATLWFTVCNFLLKGISFFSGPLFTRLLSEKEFGTVSLFYTYEQILLIFATWEIQIGSYQKGLFKYKQDIRRYTRDTVLLINIMTIVVFAMLFILYKYVEKYLGMNLLCLFFLFLYLIFRPSYDCWQQRMRMDYEYKLPVILIIVYSLLFVVIPILALMVFSPTANVKFISGLLVGVIFSFSFYFVSVFRGGRGLNRGKFQEYSKYNINFQGPFVMHSLSFLILAQADRVMIGMFTGEVDVAHYSVAYSIANTVIILQSSINQSLLPWLYHNLEGENYEYISSITKYILLGLGTMILMFLLVIPEGMKILFPQSYIVSMWCIPPMSAGVFFIFLYSLFVNFESYYEKTKYISYVSVTCAFVNILLNYFGIKMFGYIACAYTTLISYMLFAIGHYYFMNKIKKQLEIKSNVFDMRSIIIISFLFLVGSFLITMLYKYFLIRYSILAVAFAIAFIKRKIILGLLYPREQKNL